MRRYRREPAGAMGALPRTAGPPGCQRFSLPAVSPGSRCELLHTAANLGNAINQAIEDNKIDIFASSASASARRA